MLIFIDLGLCFTLLNHILVHVIWTSLHQLFVQYAQTGLNQPWTRNLVKGSLHYVSDYYLWYRKFQNTTNYFANVCIIVGFNGLFFINLIQNCIEKKANKIKAVFTVMQRNRLLLFILFFDRCEGLENV